MMRGPDPATGMPHAGLARVGTAGGDPAELRDGRAGKDVHYPRGGRELQCVPGQPYP